MSIRHIPIRSCIACRKKVDKRQLVRLVRSQDGSVLVDSSHKKMGRGAYICNNSSCWGVAWAGRAINYHLGVANSATDNIRDEIQKVPMRSNQI